MHTNNDFEQQGIILNHFLVNIKDFKGFIFVFLKLLNLFLVLA